MLGRGNVRDGGNVRNGRGSVVPSFRTFLTFLRKIAGMPDYDAYVEHLRTTHPERPVPTRQQFYEEYLAARYQAGPTRCC